MTGEQVLKRVSKVYVKETDHLIHIGTSTGEDIETTENHPFYTKERGWVAASELEEGETLHTDDGDIVTVTYNRDEWLKEPVKVYNLEVEGLHTYYVTADRVLVHNQYSELDDDALVVRRGQSSPDNLATNQAADSRGHISANPANGASLDELATTPQPFKNGQVSVTAVGDIRNAGMDVIPDPTPNNPNHVSIIPNSIPLSPEEAQILSDLFEKIKNIWR